MEPTTETFQIPVEAAEVYEARFVPALFAQWAPRLVAIADVQEGARVLDVACGTGIVARTAAPVVGPQGHVVGLDRNEAMLAVARRVSPELEWRQGDVQHLPFPDASFDTVTCQMALMFFPDRAAAVGEMRRVARPGGAVAICVPARLDDQPAYAPFVELAARHAGPSARSLLGVYWECGDLPTLRAVVTSADLDVTAVATVIGTAGFDSVGAFVATEVESTPLVERLSDAQRRRIIDEAGEVLAPYTAASGAVDVPLVAHLLVGRRPDT